MALEYAPTHINPAWPRLSSPEKPTTRFKEREAIVYTHRGTRRPVSRFDRWPDEERACTITKSTSTIA
jgi:hypothetical protein